MLSVTCKPYTLSVIMLNAIMPGVIILSVIMLSFTCKPYTLSVIMLNVVMLSVIIVMSLY